MGLKCKVCGEEIINPPGKQQIRKKFCSYNCYYKDMKRYQTFYWHSHQKWQPRTDYNLVRRKFNSLVVDAIK